MKQKRNKAFLGALAAAIGIGSSLLSAGFNARAQRKAAEAQAAQIREENRQKRIAANQENTTNAMQNLNNIYNNQDYLNDYYNRFNTLSTESSLRCGGKKKIKRCGGRKKGELGTSSLKTNNTSSSNSNTSNNFGLLSSIGNLATNLINGIGVNNATNILGNVKKEYYNPSKINISGYSGDTYNNVNDSRFKDRFSTFKCGGKKKR